MSDGRTSTTNMTIPYSVLYCTAIRYSTVLQLVLGLLLVDRVTFQVSARSTCTHARTYACLSVYRHVPTSVFHAYGEWWWVGGCCLIFAWNDGGLEARVICLVLRLFHLFQHRAPAGRFAAVIDTSAHNVCSLRLGFVSQR